MKPVTTAAARDERARQLCLKQHDEPSGVVTTTFDGENFAPEQSDQLHGGVA